MQKPGGEKQLKEKKEGTHLWQSLITNIARALEQPGFVVPDVALFKAIDFVHAQPRRKAFSCVANAPKEGTRDFGH